MTQHVYFELNYGKAINDETCSSLKENGPHKSIGNGNIRSYCFVRVGMSLGVGSRL